MDDNLTRRARGPEESAKLSPTAIDRLEQAILSALYDDQRILLDCTAT